MLQVIAFHGSLVVIFNTMIFCSMSYSNTTDIICLLYLLNKGTFYAPNQFDSSTKVDE